MEELLKTLNSHQVDNVKFDKINQIKYNWI
jgi:hypothetical protein